MQAEFCPSASRPSLRPIERFEGEAHDAMREIRELRARCWPDIYTNGHTLEDGFDDRAIHWFMRGDLKISAAARLTIHTDLKVLPDPHLFAALDPAVIPFPTGYISRLVVDPQARGQGLAHSLDSTRMNEAVARGCKTMIAVWNPTSGEARRQQLYRWGFQSFDGETAWPDGAFGHSHVYFLDLRVLPSAPSIEGQY